MFQCDVWAGWNASTFGSLRCVIWSVPSAERLVISLHFDITIEFV